jgi:hypothetical protein
VAVDPSPFDPYESVLGIPAGNRPTNCPPNHYDLIGAAMFEPDISVLAHTADAQIIRLRKSKIDHETMNQLFYELCLARGVLTNAVTKAGYDQQLRADFELPADLFAGHIEPSHVEDGQLDGGQFNGASLDDATFTPLAGRPKERRSSPAAAVLVNLAIAGAALFYFRPWDQKLPAPAQQQNGPSTGYWPEKPKPIARSQDTVPLNHPPSRATAKPPATKPAEPQKMARVPLDPTTDPADGEPIDREPESPVVDEPAPIGDPAAAPEPAEKLAPVPSKKEHAAAMAALMEIYGKEIGAAHRANNHTVMLGIRQQLIDAARDEKDPAVKFAMLSLAYRLTIDSGQLDLAIELAGSIADQFDIDELSLRWEAISEYSKKHGKEPELRQMLRDLVRQAQEAENLELALVAMQKLHSIHPKSSLWKTKDLEGAVEAVKQLRADPKRADSAEVLGEYLCFVLEHWKSGLPLLAKGTNAELREIAAADLSEPDDVAAQCQLADRWWDFNASKLAGDALPENAAIACHARAAYWYQKAAKDSVQRPMQPEERDPAKGGQE